MSSNLISDNKEYINSSFISNWGIYSLKVKRCLDKARLWVQVSLYLNVLGRGNYVLGISNKRFGKYFLRWEEGPNVSR